MRVALFALVLVAATSQPALTLSIEIRTFLVFFARGSSEIPDGFRSQMADAAEFARVTDANHVFISGCIETAEANSLVNLSERRVHAVGDALVALGVDPAIITTEGNESVFCEEYRDRGDPRLERRVVIGVNPRH